MKYSDWQEVQLKDIAEFGKDRIAVTEIGAADYISTVNMLPEKGEIELAEALPKTKTVNKATAGDTLISNIRPYFKKIWYCNTDYGVSSDVLIIRPKNEIVDNKFLYFFLSQDRFFDFMVSTSKGTKMPRGDKQAIMNYTLKLPPYSEQVQIAELFTFIEEKIALNNGVNENLEEMAQAIFKHWFVDFEFPNENGEPYKSSGGKFVESELGMIPEGWEIKSLDDIASYQNGLAMQKFRPENPDISLPVLKIKELRRGFTDETSDRCRDDIDEKVIVDDGDIIFSWSGTLLVKIWLGGKAGLNQHLFKVTSETFPKWFYYYWTKYHLERFIKIAADRATTMGHIKRSHLKEALVVVPDQVTLNRLSETFHPLVEKKINLGIESRYLREIRDTLLPKLMSGEIRIHEAEQELEACLQKTN